MNFENAKNLQSGKFRIKSVILKNKQKANKNKQTKKLKKKNKPKNKTKTHRQQQGSVRVWSEKNPHVLLTGIQSAAATLENSWTVPQKAEHQSYRMTRQFHS